MPFRIFVLLVAVSGRAASGESPHFLEESGDVTNVTVLVGKHALLPCAVRDLGSQRVSWVRHRDVQILSTGKESFIGDSRFQVLTDPKDQGRFDLRIDPSRNSDSGLYECQINTRPIRSRFVNLRVAVPIAKILGASELFVDQGSTINLTCVVSDSPEPPEGLTWTHDQEAVSPHRLPRGGVSIITEKGHTTVSYLLIKNAQKVDSGLYKCKPSNASPVHTNVHVIDGEYPAAMQTGSELRVRMDSFVSWMCLLLSLYVSSVSLPT